MDRYHYLGRPRLVGERLRYAAFLSGELVGLLGWAAAALKCATSPTVTSPCFQTTFMISSWAPERTGRSSDFAITCGPSRSTREAYYPQL